MSLRAQIEKKIGLPSLDTLLTNNIRTMSYNISFRWFYPYIISRNYSTLPILFGRHAIFYPSGAMVKILPNLNFELSSKTLSFQIYVVFKFR